jgi:hypothetical protein
VMSVSATSATKMAAARDHTYVSRSIPTRVRWMIRVLL